MHTAVSTSWVSEDAETEAVKISVDKTLRAEMHALTSVSNMNWKVPCF